MKSSRFQRRRSAAIAGTAAVAGLLLAVIAGYYRSDRRLTARLVLEETAERLAAEANYDERVILARGDDIRRRTLFYSSLLPVSGMIRAIQGGGVDPVDWTTLAWWRTNLQQLFSEAVRLNPDITQIRFIGIEDGGRELVRVDRPAGGSVPVVTAEESLQRKGDRYYFTEALRLEKGEVYVSDVDLNQEQGKIVQPEVATVRVATPIADARGRPFGVVVANFDFRMLAADVEDSGKLIAARRHQTFLTDDQGNYLIAPLTGRAFRHERSPGAPGWNQEFAVDPTVADRLGVPLPAGLVARRGPEETVLFHAPAEVRLGSRLAPLPLQLWQGMPLRLVEEEIRVATRTQRMAAVAMSAAVLGLMGLTVAGFSRRQTQVERSLGLRLERAARAGRVGIWEHDVESGETVWNDEGVRILGVESEAFRGQPAALLELVHPEDRDRIRSLAGELAGKPEFSARFRIVRPDGAVRFLVVQGAPEHDPRGQLIRLFGTGTDQTEIQQAQQAVAESEHQYRQVTESLPQLVWTCKADGPCDYLSPQWVRYTGIEEARQLGYGWLEQLHPDDRQRAIDTWMATAARGKVFEIDFRIRRHDGVYR